MLMTDRMTFQPHHVLELLLAGNKMSAQMVSASVIPVSLHKCLHKTFTPSSVPALYLIKLPELLAASLPTNATIKASPQRN